jgi:hypothetical protein
MQFILLKYLPRYITGSNPLGQGTLVYVDSFTRDAIHECEEALLGFPHEVFLGKKCVYVHAHVRVCVRTHT